MRSRRWIPAPALAAMALAAVIVAPACGGDGPSTAAEEFISQAEDAEEREGLRQARDDIDSEMRRIVAERDAEIDRLRKEREELEARLRERGLEP